ncbi:MAG: hypothetical protein WCS67_01565 [Bacteroidales bacterium]
MGTNFRKGALALLSVISLVGIMSEPSGSLAVWALCECACMTVFALSSRALIRLLDKEGDERC